MSFFRFWVDFVEVEAEVFDFLSVLGGVEAEIFDLCGFWKEFGRLGAEIFDFLEVLGRFWRG